MSRLDKIRSMNDDELIAFLRKYRNKNKNKDYAAGRV